jgi:predicted lipase
MHTLCCPAHYAMIFGELMEVYDPDVTLTLDDMIRPFINKKITQKIPARGIMRDPENIKYSDYIIPLFYTAYVCKSERSDRIIKEVLCAILREYGHFHYPKTMWDNLKFQYGDNWNDPRHYWGFQYPAITEEERLQWVKLYHNYVDIVK